MSLAPEVSTAEQTASPARIQQLLYSSRRVATGLHWSDSSDWLRQDPAWTRVLWQDDRLVGLLACAPPHAGCTWLQVCALADDVDATLAFPDLWQCLGPVLQQRGVREAHLLDDGQDWLRACLLASAFTIDEQVITLGRPLHTTPPCPSGAGHIRLATDDDLDPLLALDEAAFPPHWRMPARDLRRALRRAASFTVMELNGVIRACQITTRDHDEAHLSRLAVHPDHQGMGHGSRILADVMHRCRRRGLTSLSVNTQRHNRRSLRLYRRFGFRHTGPDYQVWSQRIPENEAAI
ncbi:MAG: GNAT family N-acetyltransferase [Anaerolineaceae bacterium]|nr:GNAT family N-acetyltransferase [Anaerolineaceae bacterium]